MTTLEKMVTLADNLSEKEQLILANRLLGELDSDLDAEIESSWDSEIQDRIQRYRQGDAKSTPANEVFAKADSLLNR